MIDNIFNVLSAPLTGAKILISLIVATLSTGNSVYFDEPFFLLKDSSVVVKTTLLNGYNSNIRDLIVGNNTIVLYYYYKLNNKSYNVFNKISFDPLKDVATIDYSNSNKSKMVVRDSLKYYFENNKFIFNKLNLTDKNTLYIETKIFLQTDDNRKIKLWNNSPKYICQFYIQNGEVVIDN